MDQPYPNKNSPWGLLVKKYIGEKGISATEFCLVLGLKGKGEPIQKWLAGAKPGKSTLEKNKAAAPHTPRAIGANARRKV